MTAPAAYPSPAPRGWVPFPQPPAEPTRKATCERIGGCLGDEWCMYCDAPLVPAQRTGST